MRATFGVTLDVWRYGGTFGVTQGRLALPGYIWRYPGRYPATVWRCPGTFGVTRLRLALPGYIWRYGATFGVTG